MSLIDQKPMSILEQANLYKSFVNASCFLAKGMDPVYFVGLYQETNNKICVGCAWEPGCVAKVTIKRAQQRGTPITTLHKTNAQLAKELNVSKRQVAKMRAAGTLTE